MINAISDRSKGYVIREDRKFFSLETIEYELNIYVFDCIYWKMVRKNERKLSQECLLEWTVKEK